MMINSLELKAINQFGIDGEFTSKARYKAGSQFSRALQRGKMHRFWKKLRRNNDHLLDLSETAKGAKPIATRQNGIVSIPLNKIVGSEGRSLDFDENFYPLQSHTRDRWVNIAAARRRGVTLPPVELVQFGDQYFVRDGNHRVSVARNEGQEEIDARVVYELVK